MIQILIKLKQEYESDFDLENEDNILNYGKMKQIVKSLCINEKNIDK